MEEMKPQDDVKAMNRNGIIALLLIVVSFALGIIAAQ